MKNLCLLQMKNLCLLQMTKDPPISFLFLFVVHHCYFVHASQSGEIISFHTIESFESAFPFYGVSSTRKRWVKMGPSVWARNNRMHRTAWNTKTWTPKSHLCQRTFPRPLTRRWKSAATPPTRKTRSTPINQRARMTSSNLTTFALTTEIPRNQKTQRTISRNCKALPDEMAVQTNHLKNRL